MGVQVLASACAFERRKAVGLVHALTTFGFLETIESRWPNQNYERSAMAEAWQYGHEAGVTSGPMDRDTSGQVADDHRDRWPPCTAAAWLPVLRRLRSGLV